MSTDAKVQIGNSGEFLEGVNVTTPAGANLFREGVVASDPDNAQGRAKVLNSEPTGNEYGMAVRHVGSQPLPTGAATESTLAAANTNLGTDGATPPTITGTGIRGWLRGIYEKLLPLTFTSINELTIAFRDIVSGTITITAQDVGSTSTAGANGQVLLTGTPTANSTASLNVNGDSSFSCLITGTFTGTLQFERSLDNGATWTAVGAFAAGTAFAGSTTTLPGAFHGNCSSSNAIRVRATTAFTGTASVRLLAGAGTGTITVGNPVRIFDTLNGAQVAVKQGNVASSSADNAMVVSLSPNGVGFVGPQFGFQTSAGRGFGATTGRLLTTLGSVSQNMLVLYNPAGSGKTLYLYRIFINGSFGQNNTAAFERVRFVGGAPTGGVLITPVNRSGSATASIAQVRIAVGGTALTGVVFAVGSVLSLEKSTLLITGGLDTSNEDGSLIIAPGSGISMQLTTTAAATQTAEFVWHEV